MPTLRPVLDEERVHPAIREKISTRHQDILDEVMSAVDAHDVVVIGMAQNPHVKKAKTFLNAASVDFHYMQYGSYLSEWRRRNVLKMWTQWPTFPMIFVKGTLVGGAADVQALIESGELKAMLG